MSGMPHELSERAVVCALHPEMQAQITELLSQFHDLKMSVLRIVAIALSAITGVVGIGTVI